MSSISEFLFYCFILNFSNSTRNGSIIIPFITHVSQAVKKIASRYSGCGIRSASFQENILTVGTGLGMLMFYDVRAGKYLESSINSSRTVVLKSSKGYVVSKY